MKHVLTALALSVLTHLPTQSVAAPVLTVIFPDANGEAQTIEYTDEEILALEQVEITTDNDYVDDTAVFSGPRLRDVFGDQEIGSEDSIRLRALNDYSTEMPASEALDYDVILALSMNGERLSVRDKGPIWVIYPMSEHEELREPRYNDRLVWQLSSVELLPSR
jgi:hypothetical protein